MSSRISNSDVACCSSWFVRQYHHCNLQMTRTWAGIFFYSCGTFCVQWVFWGHLETSGVWGQSWEAHGSAPCFSSCSVTSIFGHLLNNFWVFSRHIGVRGGRWSWSAVSALLPASHLPPLTLTASKRRSGLRLPVPPWTPTGGEVKGELEEESKQADIRRDFEGNPKRLRVPNWTEKGQKVTEILPRRPLPAQVYSVHLRCKAVVRLLFGSQGVWFHKVNYQS